MGHQLTPDGGSCTELYRPLIEDKDEIRVFQFPRRECPNSEDDRLELELEHVSLNKHSEAYKRHTDDTTNETPCAWQDIYTEIMDSRLEDSDDSKSDDSAHTRDMPSGRFTWGDFEAVSYTWEDDNSKSILLNGQTWTVSENLELALRKFQKLSEARLGMKFWVDALCINQKDDVERNHQVKRMGTIYSSARAVTVWLGKASESDPRALQAMRATWRDPEQNGWLKPPSNLNRDDWDALVAFMGKRYWNRVWIIQELALNHTSTLFLCGDLRLNRDMIKTGAACCQKVPKEDPRFPTKNNPTIWQLASRVSRLLTVSISGEDGSAMNTALSLARQAECEDLRDKVYGILGLVDEEIHSKLIPDYSKSSKDVYIDLTKAIIHSTNSLEQIIYQTGLPQSDLPSWTSNLALPFLRNHMRCVRERQASKNFLARFSFLPEVGTGLPTLSCKGLRVDAVDGIAASSVSLDDPIQPRHSQKLSKKHSRRSISRVLVMDHEKTKTRPTLLQVPWLPDRVLLRGVEKSQEWNEVFKSEEYKAFHAFRKANKDFRVGDKTFKQLFPTSLKDPTGRNKMSYQSGLAVTSLRGRRLITTEKGLIGLVPEAVQQGDVIAVLLGCNCPVLLRPEDTYFRVLGECYIHDLMDGQAFDKDTTGGVVDFLLR